jgi:putative transposase
MGRIESRCPGVSIRRISRWLRLRRGNYYRRKKCSVLTVDRASAVISQEAWIAQMRQVRRAHPSWGFRLILAYLKRKGAKISRKRAYSLYRVAKMGLHRYPKKTRIKRAFEQRLPPAMINEGWAMDFMSEWVIGEKQQSVRVINIVDECSRKAIWIEAAHSITADKLLEILDCVVSMRGYPRYIRCDNGPEFISHKLAQWAEGKVEIKFIQPGKPTQNGIIERLNGTVRVECLNLHWFESIQQVNEELDKWYQTYNFERPHSCLKNNTPDDFEKQNQNLYFRLVAA